MWLRRLVYPCCWHCPPVRSRRRRCRPASPGSGRTATAAATGGCGSSIRWVSWNSARSPGSARCSSSCSRTSHRQRTGARLHGRAREPDRGADVRTAAHARRRPSRRSGRALSRRAARAPAPAVRRGDGPFPGGGRARSPCAPAGPMPPASSRAFALADLTGDGRLTLAELARVLRGAAFFAGDLAERHAVQPAEPLAASVALASWLGPPPVAALCSRAATMTATARSPRPSSRRTVLPAVAARNHDSAERCARPARKLAWADRPGAGAGAAAGALAHPAPAAGARTSGSCRSRSWAGARTRPARAP